MVRWCGCFLILAALFSSGSPLYAASSAENRAYDVADKAFRLESWDYAENKFAEFVQKYPKSPRVAEAILFQAMARYHLQHFADVIGLLTVNQNRAGMWEDEYLYWIAQAHVRIGNNRAAADVFARLSKDFPDSPQRLEATIDQATAVARLGEWPRVAQLLQEPNGVFRRAADSTPTNAWVNAGYLLLGEAELAQDHLNGVQTALEFLDGQTFDPELAWRREYLRCRLQVAEGQPEAALANTTNLLALAGAPVPEPPGTNATPAQPVVQVPRADRAKAGLLAESWSFRGSVLEQLNRLDDAIAAYEHNLITNAPVEQQRQALYHIAELNQAQHRYEVATKTLEDYLSHQPHSGAADMALLTIGELQLKQGALAKSAKPENPSAAPATTNLVQEALARFDELLGAFPQSPLAGKALLDKGWCLWTDGRYAPSAEAFRLAAEQLPLSEDQAVARFKWADAQFMRQDFAGAATNYSFVATQYRSLPGMPRRLLELALYQTVRAALPGDLTAASQALRTILDSYPDSFAGPHSLLLLGQGFSEQGDPAGARGLFADFERSYPTNSLLPEVRLAVARTYEQEKNWDAAAGEYADWIRRFTNHAGLPRAEFCRARDHFMAGQVTNAFMLFTNFIARFPTNDLAQQAQWWIADFYFGRGQFHDAENNYQLVYKNTNWPPSELTYQAQMMAGLAAMASFGYKDAFSYFTNLAANPACPLDLRLQATIACGDALTSRTDSGATNRLADFREAISWFDTIAQTYPTHALAPVAWGRIGDCCLQLGESDPKFYDRAANAYQQVIASPQARIPARSQATMGLGLVAEGRARLKSGDEQAALLRQALRCYQDVFFYENDLRSGEPADPFWIKKAGLEAGRLAESLQQWPLAIHIYQKLQQWLPQMRSALEKKILNAQANLPPENP